MPLASSANARRKSQKFAESLKRYEAESGAAPPPPPPPPGPPAGSPSKKAARRGVATSGHSGRPDLKGTDKPSLSRQPKARAGRTASSGASSGGSGHQKRGRGKTRSESAAAGGSTAWQEFDFAKTSPIPPYSVRVVKLRKGVDGLGLELEPAPVDVPPFGRCVVIVTTVEGWLAEASGVINDGDVILKVQGVDATGKGIEEVVGMLKAAPNPAMLQLAKRVNVRKLGLGAGVRGALPPGVPVKMLATVQQLRRSGATLGASKVWKKQTLELRAHEVEMCKPVARGGEPSKRHALVALDMHTSVGRLPELAEGFFIRRTARGTGVAADGGRGGAGGGGGGGGGDGGAEGSKGKLTSVRLELRAGTEEEADGWVAALRQNLPAQAVREQADLHKVIALAMASERHGVEVKDRKKMMKTHRQCFLGSEAVTWMVLHDHVSNTEEAAAMAQRMVDARLVLPAGAAASSTGSHHIFRPDKALFKFDQQRLRELGAAAAGMDGLSGMSGMSAMSISHSLTSSLYSARGSGGGAGAGGGAAGAGTGAGASARGGRGSLLPSSVSPDPASGGAAPTASQAMAASAIQGRFNPLGALGTAGGAAPFADALVEPYRIKTILLERHEGGGLGFQMQRVVTSTGGEANVDQAVVVKGLVEGGPIFAEGSPFASMGPGDVVTHVNGVDISGLRLLELEEMLQESDSPIDLSIAEAVGAGGGYRAASLGAGGDERPVLLKAVVRQERATGQKGARKVWKEQWLSLAATNLNLFGPPSSKSKMEAVLRGTIDLAGPKTNVLRRSDGELQFGLMVSGTGWDGDGEANMEVWVLKAKSASEADAWVDLIDHNRKLALAAAGGF